MSHRRVVFLLHGLWRSRFSFLRLEGHLRRAGFVVANRSYPTARKSMAEHAADLAAWVDRTIAERRPAEVHFVTHSMGGMVARYYLTHHPLALPGRLVMLAPPNQGSRKMEMIKAVPLFRLFLGPHAGRDLGQGEDAAFREAGVPARDFGVIAGGTGGSRGYSFLLPGDNDGTVTVEETRMPGMKDFLLVPRIHTFIMNAPEVIEATIRFLNTGRF